MKKLRLNYWNTLSQFEFDYPKPNNYEYIDDIFKYKDYGINSATTFESAISTSPDLVLQILNQTLNSKYNINFNEQFDLSKFSMW
jgi:hypothetical protein